MEFKKVKIEVPEGCNVIFGISHFIKTVEDVHEALVSSAPNIKFGVGFCEASGPCLVRYSGNDNVLIKLAREKAYEVSAGHTFIIFLKDAYPINVLPVLKSVPEICSILAATSNPLEIVLVETEQGRGVVSVVDGFKSKGIEKEKDIRERKEFLRKIGYKL